ncbi:unnamed protein product [Pleuronectes platessa]|uniref:Uncharacterized protein n=1 Tax=Pleuronectes platessa TaxID=8262 RepID=A0A9N7UNT9_PLEPL|nr:unnamed protein product [Pleuronectes platessa]
MSESSSSSPRLILRARSSPDARSSEASVRNGASPPPSGAFGLVLSDTTADRYLSPERPPQAEDPPAVPNTCSVVSAPCQPVPGSHHSLIQKHLIKGDTLCSWSNMKRKLLSHTVHFGSSTENHPDRTDGGLLPAPAQPACHFLQKLSPGLLAQWEDEKQIAADLIISLHSFISPSHKADSPLVKPAAASLKIDNKVSEMKTSGQLQARLPFGFQLLGQCRADTSNRLDFSQKREQAGTARPLHCKHARKPTTNQSGETLLGTQLVRSVSPARLGPSRQLQTLSTGIKVSIYQKLTDVVWGQAGEMAVSLLQQWDADGELLSITAAFPLTIISPQQ